MVGSTYVPRLVDATLDDLLGEFPAIFLVGPRAAGKTTTARRYAATVVRLDREREAAAFRADPDAALARFDEPLLLDEWQVVPTVLGAVKRAVDDDPRPRRFLLTGSVTAEHDPATWPGVGRLIRLSMYGLTQRELLGRLGNPSFIEALLAGEPPSPPPVPDDAPDLGGYVDLALQGTFPEPALRVSPSQRHHWFLTYVEQLVGRDVTALGGPDPARLRRYLEAVASCTAGVVSDTTLLDLAGIDRKTAAGYERFLTGLYAVDVVPAWSSRRVSRLVKIPKRYITDPALASAVLGADTRSVLRDGDVLGRLLDTFVAAQIRPELDIAASPARRYHLRETQGRHEVDLVIEHAGRGVVAIEIKADAGPGPSAGRHLVWLRDRLGDSFLAGVVLHTGPSSYPLDDRIIAAPICALWS